MKRLTQISVVGAFVVAAFISIQAPVLYNVAGSDSINKGKSSGFEFEDPETAQNDKGGSYGFEFEDPETAQNDEGRSKGFEFEEIETA